MINSESLTVVECSWMFASMVSEALKATAGFAEENCLFFDLQCSVW